MAGRLSAEHHGCGRNPVIPTIVKGSNRKVAPFSILGPVVRVRSTAALDCNPVIPTIVKGSNRKVAPFSNLWPVV